MSDHVRCDKGPIIDAIRHEVEDIYTKVNNNVSLLREVVTRLGISGVGNGQSVLGRLDRLEKDMDKLSEYIQRQEITNEVLTKLAGEAKIAGEKRDKNFRWAMGLLGGAVAVVNIVLKFVPLP